MVVGSPLGGMTDSWTLVMICIVTTHINVLVFDCIVKYLFLYDIMNLRPGSKSMPLIGE